MSKLKVRTANLLMRWPYTSTYVVLLIGMGVLLLSFVLWRPVGWILLGIVIAWTLVDSVKRDRRRRKKNDHE